MYIKFLLNFLHHFLVCFTMEQTWPNLFLCQKDLSLMWTLSSTFSLQWLDDIPSINPLMPALAVMGYDDHWPLVPF